MMKLVMMAGDKIDGDELGGEGMAEMVKLSDKVVIFCGDSRINRELMVLLH